MGSRPEHHCLKVNAASEGVGLDYSDTGREHDSLDGAPRKPAIFDNPETVWELQGHHLSVPAESVSRYLNEYIGEFHSNRIDRRELLYVQVQITGRVHNRQVRFLVEGFVSDLF